MAKEIIMGIDAADHLCLGFEKGIYYGKEQLRSLIRNCAQAGIKTIYWRVSATGQVTYPSKVRTVLGSIVSLPPGAPVNRPLSVEYMIVRHCDPPAVVVDEARKCGLKLFLYVTLFDEYHPGLESRFELNNPQFTWKHRMFDHWVRGLLSYAYPQVRQHRLAELRELIEYGPDGLFLDVSRSHAAAQPVLGLPLTARSPFLNYGYNQIEVEAFANKTGLDALAYDRAQGQPLPIHQVEYQWFRGRYLTQFLREARELTNQAGMQLSVGFYTDAECYLSPAGQRGHEVMGLFGHHYKTWLAEDLVDAFVIYAEHRRFGAKDWREHSEAQFRDAQSKGKKVYVSAATEAMIDLMEDPPGELPLSVTADRELFVRGLERGIRQCLDTSADGVYLYEAEAAEKYDYWKELGRILKQ